MSSGDKKDLVRKVYDALAKVIDPELGLDVVSAGLITGVEVLDEGKKIRIKFRPTALGCPLLSYFIERIAASVKDVLSRELGEEVDVEVVVDYESLFKQYGYLK